jgi:hypothetical protein
MSDKDSKSSKIAIQLGKGSANSPLRIKSRARPAYEKRHRAHALHDDESGSEDEAGDEGQSYGRLETITHYGPEGEELGDDARDGRGVSSKSAGATAKTQNGDTPSNPETDDGKARRDDRAASDSEPKEDKPIKFGLTINMKTKQGNKGGKGGESKSKSDRSASEAESAGVEKPTKSIEDEAIDALLGSSTPKRRKLDSDATDREPQLEDYRAVPIDDFGATLLRNFGWDGKMRGKIKEVTRHANLTGLGAKDAKGAEDLGAWNQKTIKDSRPVRLEDYQREERKKRQRVDDRYADSYKRERERERERDRGRDR